MKNRRKKGTAGKHPIVLVIVLMLSFFLTGGLWYLKKSIPDRLNVASLSDVDSLELPFNSMIKDEVVYASAGAESMKIPSEQIRIQCSFLGIVPLKTVEVSQKILPEVYPGGDTIGIFMKTQGVLIVGTGIVNGADGQKKEPALGIVQSGDYIIKINGQVVSGKKEVIDAVNQSEGKAIQITVLRGENEKNCELTPVRTEEGDYKVGIWVREDTQGIGTLTYADTEKHYGALGHGISDVDTGELLKIQGGTLYRASVQAVKKGEKGNPGELAGMIYYQEDQILGDITENGETGIKGTLNTFRAGQMKNLMQVAYRQEIKEGTASIFCCVDGEIREYQTVIEKINFGHRDVNKSMVIRVTDAELLEKTGGIVQGMSGSPIIQNGKLIGAVTHVFIADPSRGYAIFAENMIEG